MGSPISLLTPDRLLTVDRLLTADALAVTPEVGELIGRQALDRSQWITCEGQGSFSLAAAMLSAATQQGSWLAILATPTLGVEAISELGVDLGRVVAVDADLESPMQWADRVVACSDGFDLVLTTMPTHIPDRIWRSMSQRTRRNGTVVVGLYTTGSHSTGSHSTGSHSTGSQSTGSHSTGSHSTGDLRGVDLRCRVVGSVWEGLGRGSGRFVARRLQVEVAARRLPGVRKGQLVLR
jgi:hypothetical protein